MNRLVTYLMSVLFIFALSAIILWFIIYEPYVKEDTELQEAISSSQKLVKRYKEAKDQIVKLEQEIDGVKQNIFRKLCTAKGRSIEEFLKELEVDSNDSKIQLDSVRIDSISSLDLWSKIPLEFNIGGPYFQLFDFLARIQKRGKMDFSTGVLSITSETKTGTIPELMKLVDQSKTKYQPNQEFPNLRVNLNGEIIIIDKNHLLKYRTEALSSCDGV
jgi:Tfp pilus assembly protein PilO